MLILPKYPYPSARSCEFSFRVLCFWVLMMVAIPFCGVAQEDDSYDEVSVILNVQRIGAIEIPIIIQGQSAYLPVKDIFDFLRIKNALSADMESVEGSFVAANGNYLIDRSKGRIEYQNRIYNLKHDDLIKTETNLYLKLEYFGDVFGLNCNFNFRNLSVSMTTKIELPAILEMQQELLRQNINKLKGEKKADTTIGRRFPLFHLGIADWAVFSTQQTNLKSNTRLNLALGAVILGGEASAFLNVNSTTKYRKEDQFYKWRYVNNEFAPVRQVSVGSIFTPSTSTLYAPINGIQVSNTPTTYRRSFGTYLISNTTQPGWMVELYINGVLVNYVKADASGFYTFEVPLVYGTSQIRLRYYGPWGEVITSEENINIPFNFLPKNQFEYTLTSGIVQDGEKSLFSRGIMNYGLSRRITLGSGVEQYASANNGNPMPFINTSVRLGSNFLFTGEHTFGVISRGLLSYQMRSKARFEFAYSKYEKGQSAIKSGKGVLNNYLEERKLVASVPIKTRKLASFSRLTLNQLILPNITYNSGELLLSTNISGVSTNLTTTVAYTNPANKIINSNLSLTIRMDKGVRITPLLQYDYTQKNFTRIRNEVEKSLSNKGFLNVTYERDVMKNLNYYGLGFRYNLSMVQFAVFGRHGKSGSSATQALNGSLMYNDKTQSLSVSNQNNVGRAGLVIVPFLDINCNGKRDSNEPKVDELGLRVNAGRTIRNDKDTTIRVIGLEAYNHYFIDLDKNSFDNIAWKIKNPSIKVIAEPNHFKLIEVPISVVGEASGNVLVKNGKVEKGVGRLIVNIYHLEGGFVARALTESDGYFSYLGLAPGKYYASVDEGQMKKLKMTSEANRISFVIKPSRDGDIFSNLNFTLIAGEEN